MVFTMKKLATLLLAAGLVFGAATGASAIDFKAKGQWVMNFDMGTNGDFNSNQGGYNASQDNFEAGQRVRLGIEAIASENLSGTLFMQFGDKNNSWGKNSARGGNGGNRVGDRDYDVSIKHAYIDWIVPNTDLKIRMGKQPIALPGFAEASPILDDDATGIVASYAFNENVAATLLWARLDNDNYVGTQEHDNGSWDHDGNLFDNADLFALLVPVTLDGAKVTPWVGYATIGRDSTYINGVTGTNTQEVKDNYFGERPDTTYSMFAAGLSGEITMADPFRFAWDFGYTNLSTGRAPLNAQGWYGVLLGEYKMDWGTPGLYAWYASGHSDDWSDGSGQVVTIAQGTSMISPYTLDGNATIGRDSVLGDTIAGTWGIGARLKDMSFVEGLKHTLRVNYFRGTNNEDFWLGGDQESELSSSDVKNQLTHNEGALEIGLNTEYQIYENLKVVGDLAYVTLFLDDDFREDAANDKRGSVEYGDAFNANVQFIYSF